MQYYLFLLGEPSGEADDEQSFQAMLSEIEVAERGAFRGCFVAEHHNDRSHSLTSVPMLLIATAFARTSRLRLGTMVTILGIHHPYFVAEEVATLDVLSSGRAECGFGAGGPRWWRQVGIDHKEARDRLDEGIALVDRFLACEQMDYEGRFWKGQDALVVPRPVQKPRPPLWLSGHSEDTIERAARLGLDFCTGFVSCPTARARRSRYRDLWEQHWSNSAPGRMGHMILAAVGDSRRDIERYAMPAVRDKLYEFARLTLGKTSDPTFTFERALRERYGVETWDDLLDEGIVVYGTAEECTDRLGEINDRGGDVLLIQTRFGELDETFCRESLSRLSEEVLPAVGGEVAADLAPSGSGSGQ